MQQPVALLDALLDILGDALVVSPLVRSADLNLQLSRLPASNWQELAEIPLLRRATRPLSTYNLTGSPLSRSWTAQLSADQLLNLGRLAMQRAQSHKVRSFCYLFAHQTEHSAGSAGQLPAGPSSDRLASAHGDELPFLFGAPLAAQLIHAHEAGSLSGGGNSLFGYFAGNYSRAELGLSEAVITYWSNFVKFG